ncbi:MAG: TonB-dependent receptor, partial [Candidatus Latescibacteria bacterium]|nr:TonB-dependent receptor [Candidatus Latescibacterota bacterium]
PTATLTGTVNWARDDHGVFIQWKDRNEPLEVPILALDNRTLSNKLNVNLSYYRLIGSRAGLTAKSFVYRTSFDNQVEGEQSSRAYKFGQEVQADLQPSDLLSLTLGAEWIGDRTRSSPTMFGDHSGLNLAAYAQAEIRAGDRATASAGARYDRHRTDSRPGAHRVSPKLGLTFHATRATVLRGALGWGFRGPSIAEIYTDATFAGVPIAPNPDLDAERSLSCEIGIQHRIGGLAQLGAAGFWSRYRDLIEARPDASGVVSFRNVSRGRISGVEASLEASWRRLRIEGSYTYLRATEDLPSGKDPLPYRPRHVAHGSLQIDLTRLALQGRMTFRSRIDRASGLFPEGARDLIEIYLVDLSIRIPLGPANLTLTAHNLLEYNYAEVERNLGPPRRFALGLSGTL